MSYDLSDAGLRQRVARTRELAADRISLLGKHVNVTLNKEEGIVARGVLLGFGTDGTIELYDTSDGSIHYCWPLLEIAEYPEGQSATPE